MAYYRALASGPVSMVVPTFGTFIVTSSLIWTTFLDEPLIARGVAGVAFAMLATYPTSIE